MGQKWPECIFYSENIHIIFFKNLFVSIVDTLIINPAQPAHFYTNQ